MNDGSQRPSPFRGDCYCHRTGPYIRSCPGSQRPSPFRGDCYLALSSPYQCVSTDKSQRPSPFFRGDCYPQAAWRPAPFTQSRSARAPSEGIATVQDLGIGDDRTKCRSARAPSEGIATWSDVNVEVRRTFEVAAPEPLPRGLLLIPPSHRHPLHSACRSARAPSEGIATVTKTPGHRSARSDRHPAASKPPVESIRHLAEQPR